MPAHPIPQSGLRIAQSGTHWGSPVCDGIKPDRKPDCLVDQSPRAVICLAGAFLDALRALGQLAHRDERAPGQFATESRTNFRAVTDNADVVIVAHAFGLRALDDEVLEETIDGVGDTV